MPSKKVRLKRAAAGLRMRSRNSLIRLRDSKLRPMGVKSLRSLISIPVLLALILTAGWLKMPAVERASFRPSEEPYLSPMSGWAVLADTWGEDDRLDVSLVYAEATWAELEPAKDEYDFAAFEQKNHLNEWWAAGKKVILRLIADRPGSERHMDIPEWLFELMGGDGLAGNFYETEAGCGFSPDYSNILMRESHRRMISALAERYNAHPGVAFIEMGSLGQNGEWTVNLDDETVERLPTSTVSREYAWHYTSSFTETPMLMRRPYKETQLLQVGLYNPLLGDLEATWDHLDAAENGGYDRQIETDLMSMPDFYEQSASGAHIPEDADLEKLLTDSKPSLLRQLSESHLDYVVLESPAAQLSDEAVQSLNELTALLGYRFWVRSAEWDAAVRQGIRCKVLLCIRNDGPVPLHAGWPLALGLFDGEEAVHIQTTALTAASLLNGDNDLTTWIDIPDRLASGDYALKLAILDPHTGEPGVRLAMDECDPDTLWTALGSIRIGARQN